MAANGISTLQYKRDRQIAKLEEAAEKRAATGRRSNYDLTELPTVYAEEDNDTNHVVNNPNPDGLVVGRPWTAGSPPPPPPPPPPVGHDFFFAGDQDNWLAFGGIYTSGTFSNPAPANPSYTYPDGSYTGKTRNFTGTEWMASPNLGIGGAWQSNTITIDFWFYPTANNVQIISECNPADVVTSYHYSVLEINSSGNIKARFYNGAALTSNNTVQLNRWNHIWFTEDSQGGHSFELNGEPTNSGLYYTRTKPTGAEYFVIGLSDGTNMGSTGRFQGKVGYLSIGDYVAPSTYTNTASKFRITYTATFGTTAPDGYTSTQLLWQILFPQDVTGWLIIGPEIPQGVTVTNQTTIGGNQTQLTLSQPIHYLATNYTFVAP